VLPCPTFEDAFAAVSEGQAELAMIPIENSIAGRVADIHHLLPTSGLTSSASISCPSTST
jgi:prephenate dehydratase